MMALETLDFVKNASKRIKYVNSGMRQLFNRMPRSLIKEELRWYISGD